MATIRDIQLCQLNMLREVDRLAQKHGLHYVMTYGTFLGAYRHKGFIPWDDDLDISMPLADFRRLEKICARELDSRFFLQTPDTDVAPFNYYKMRANHTEMVEDYLQGHNMHQGIWIDIFPYVSAAKTPFGRDLQWFLLQNLGRIRARHYYRNSTNPLRKVLARMPGGLMKWLDEALLKGIEALGDKASGRYFEMANFNEKEDSFTPAGFLDDCIPWEFEGGRYYGPRDYDAYLKTYYGENYMTPVRYSHIEDHDTVRIWDAEE